MFALLDHDEGGTHVADGGGGFDQIASFRELAGLRVVEDEAVDPLEQRSEIVPCDVDPEIHGVGDDQFPVGEVSEHAGLDRGMGVGQKDDFAVGVLVGYRGGRLLEHSEIGEERIPLIHVVVVLAAPAERAGAGPPFKARKVDLRKRCQGGFMLRRPVVPHHRDDADRSEKGRRGGEVGAGASHDPLGGAAGGLDRIDSDGAGDYE